MPTPAVFLDRDETLIHNTGDLGDPAKVQLIQGAASACASMRGLGYRLFVVTNQGGVARGKYGEADVDAVNARIAELIERNSGAKIERFYYCPYHPEGTVEKYKREHPWRKPQPGMLLAAAEEYDIDLTKSWMIGDTMRDIEAGTTAGTRTILIGSVTGESQVKPTATAKSLIEAARIIASHRKPDAAEPEPEPPKRPRPAPQKPTEAARSAAHEVKLAPEEPTKKHKPFRPWGAPADGTPGGEQPQGAAPPPPAAPSPSPPPPPRPVPESEDSTVLRQILQELRGQRGGNADFAYSRMLGVVLQMVAAVCFAGALFMSGDDSLLYLKWLGASVMLQLAVIATLLYGK